MQNHLINTLQNYFGFNNKQWAMILKTEPATLSGTKKNLHCKLENRLETLNKFSKEFNPNHRAVFSKFVFGRLININMFLALTCTELNLEQIINAYDNIYNILDGKIKRKKLSSITKNHINTLH